MIISKYINWPKLNEVLNNNFLTISALLVALGCLLRLVAIPYAGITGDEPFSVWVAQHDIVYIWRFLLQGNNPPLFETILHYWIRVFGISIWALRSLMLLFSAATAIVIAAFGYKYLSKPATYFALIFFALSNISIYICNEVRAYTPLSFLVVSSIYMIYSLHTRYSWYKALLIILINISLCYMHYVSFFYISIQALFIVYYWRQTRYAWTWIIILVLTGISFMPIVINFLKLMNNYHATAAWMTAPNGIVSYYDTLFIFSNRNVFILCLIAALIIVSFYFGRINLKEALKKINLILLFLAAYTFNYVVSFVYPVNGERYTFLLYPLFVLGLAQLLFAFECKYTKWIYGLYFICIVLMYLHFNIKISKGRDFDKLVEKFKQINIDSTFTIINPGYYQLAFLYHFDKSEFSKVNNTLNTIDNYDADIEKYLRTKNIFLQKNNTIAIESLREFYYIDMNMGVGSESMTLTHFDIDTAYTFWNQLNIIHYRRKSSE